MTDAAKNLPASVAARLLNRAKQTGDDYQFVLTNFCFERFLYRLGHSDLRGRFVLKGAMLLRVWSAHPYRATRDLDLLRQGEGVPETIKTDLQRICTLPVESDAVTFLAEDIRLDAIRAEDEFAGTRAMVPVRSGTAQLRLQIDIGIGDSVWPEPRSCVYPTLLGFPAPEILAYPREAVIAEKLEALIVLGDRNSRIKDFFDLHYLAGHFSFDRPTLVEAIRRTFARRGTPVPREIPLGLTPAYWQNPTRPNQVRAFARRSGLALAGGDGAELAGLLGEFLVPLLEDLRDSTRRSGTWAPGGPWQ